MPYNTNRRFFCIGCYKNAWYICNTVPDFDIDSWASRILAKEPLGAFSREYFGDVSANPVFRYQREIDFEYFAPIFIHAKNCFNALALIKGSKFIQHEMLDQFRQCILANTNWETVIMPTKIPPSIVLWLQTNIHNHEHAVVIYIENNTIMAFSVLYGEAWGLFKLGERYLGDTFPYAAICSFETKQELWYDSGLLF